MRYRLLGLSTIEVKRGAGTSGNWGHKGRKGKVGGSAPGGGHTAIGIKPGASRKEPEREGGGDEGRTGAPPVRRSPHRRYTSEVVLEAGKIGPVNVILGSD